MFYKHRYYFSSVIALIVNLLVCSVTPAEVPKVVVSLKPIHALVSGVLSDLGRPQLLLSGSETPHTFSLRPSQVKQVHQADLIIWVGPNLEGFLKRLIASLSDKVAVLRLIDLKGLTLLTTRKGGIWHPESNSKQPIDNHIWLNPQNAQVMVQAIAQTLAQLDPEHAQHYQRNSNQLIKQLTELDQALQQQLAPVSNKAFLVFHDAYQYFEEHYQLTALGALQISSEQQPSVQRLQNLRQLIKQAAIACVFKEPQFNDALAKTVVENTTARIASLDPLGIDLTAGKEAYFELLQNLASALKQCLSANLSID